MSQTSASESIDALQTVDAIPLDDIPDDVVRPRGCRNCGTPVELSHCPACGQDYAASKRLSLKEAAIEAVQVFHFNGIVARDFKQLILNPGALTQDYIEGRRIRHLSPGRLFFLVYVAFFFAIQHIDTFEIAAAKESIDTGILAELAAARGWSLEVLDVRLENALSRAYSLWFFLLIPPLTAAMYLLHPRSRQPMVVHGVFTLHVLAFVMLLNIPDMLIWHDMAAYIVYAFVNLIVIPVYLFLSLRRVFGQGKLLAALKTVGLWVAIMGLGLLYVEWVVRWTLWTI